MGKESNVLEEKEVEETKEKRKEMRGVDWEDEERRVLVKKKVRRVGRRERPVKGQGKS